MVNTISHTPIILWVKTFSHTPYGVTKFAGKTFSSDLRKLTAVSKSLSSLNSKTNILVLKEYLYMYERVKSEELSTTMSDENSGLSTTYLGGKDMTRLDK